MSSELSLTWDDHPSTLIGVFEKLLETSSLVDCTIAAEGQYLKAHKLILSACSPYFELLFKQENEKNPIVVLKDIKFRELKAMIEFIYRGKVKVPEEHLGDFVDAAESLQIKGLGSDRRQKMSPKDTGNDGSYAQRRRGRTSPRPRKRLRRSSRDGVNGSECSSTNVLNVESDVDGSSLELHEEAPNLCGDEAGFSFSSVTNSPTSLPSNVCSDKKILETSESVSFEKIPLPLCDEVLSNPVVVKSEPEAMAEVYIPETDCYIEPKDEDIVEEELEETGGEMNSDLETNLFPAFSTMPQATSTRPETILVPQVLETTSSLGAVAGVPTTPGPSVPQTISRWPAKDCVGVLPVGVFFPATQPARKSSWRCCHVCGKVFDAASQLSRHLRTHKLFVCEMCGKKFPQKKNLKQHSVVHTKERPYVCQLCGKAYRHKKGLMMHEENKKCV